MTTLENPLPIGLTRVEAQPAVYAVEEIRLPYDLRYELIRAAATSPHAEICGFITKGMKMFLVENSADHPQNSFRMALPNYRRAIEIISSSGDEIVGIFHSHPGGSPHPSDNDLKGWPNPDLHWRYWIVTPTALFEYVKADD